jgi:hypothetical protein
MRIGKCESRGPNEFERTYTLNGAAAEHEPEAIRRLMVPLLPRSSSCALYLFNYGARREANNSLSRFHHIGLLTPNRKCANFRTRIPHLDEPVRRAINRINKPSTAAQVTELVNRDLGPKDRPFQVGEVATWLRNAAHRTLNLCWLESRPPRAGHRIVGKPKSRRFGLAVRKNTCDQGRRA